VQPFYDTLDRIRRHDGALIDLSTGEPLVDPQVRAFVAEAAARAARTDDMAKRLGAYADLDGDPQFLERLTDDMGRAFGRPVARDEVVVVPGCQFALSLVRTLAEDEGRPVCWPAPYDFPGSMFASARAVPASAWHSEPVRPGAVRYNLDVPQQLPRGCVVWLSSPHNPTGRVWPAEQLHALADACGPEGWLVLDETYALPCAPLTLQPVEFIDRPNVLHLFSFSKVGLAGERCGFIVAPRHVTPLLRRVLRRTIIQSPKLVQRVAAELIAWYRDDPSLARLAASAYFAHWGLASRALSGDAELPGLRVADWQGGPFLWLEWDRSGPHDQDVFERALACGVALMPASALACPGSVSSVRAVRLGLGVEPALLERALALMMPALRAHG
jgi:valine--pyruvate aminotransferase